MSDIAIVGSGGHAKVVFEALSGNSEFNRIAILDENEIIDTFWQSNFPSVVLHPFFDLSLCFTKFFHVAIGDNTTREEVTMKAAVSGAKERTVCHEAGVISSSARIGEGSFIAAGSIVGASSELGRGCIVNHNAVVDHDCRVGSFSHVAPGAILCGGVTVGERVLVGAGAILKPGIGIGDDCVIGAGAVVVKPLSAGTTVVGNPARVSERIVE